MLLALVGAAVLAASAAADTIQVGARAPFDASPSRVELSSAVSTGEAAFVGTTLTEGALAACAPNYAQGAALPRSFSVDQSTSQGAEVYVDSTIVPLPAGAWTLCGWVQPTGGADGVPSAVGGPVHFTVGGPVGSTAMHVPATFESEQVEIPVTYSLTQESGDIPGTSGAEIGAWAERDPSRECAAGRGRYSVSLATVGGDTLSAPSEGTAVFTGRLVPGEYLLCAYLLQNFPTLGVILPNLSSGLMFGISSSTIRVLTHPLVSGLSAQPRAFHLGRTAGTRLRYSLNEQGEVTLAVRRLLVGRGTRKPRTCVANPRGSGSVCGLAVEVGSIRLDSGAGSETLRFDGRLKGHWLAPGVYELTAVAHSQDGAVSPPAVTSFAVLR